MSQPPLDYSYRGLKVMEDLRMTRPRHIETYKRSHTGRFWTSTLRLNNNDLETLDGISEIVIQIFEIPENLTWLDLSFNQLSNLSNEITDLRNLKILYLHGNHFSDYSSVLPQLRSLPKLYSLTLHGNPVEERKGYRLKIILALPRLRKLDFTNVTACDLQNVRKPPARDTLTS